MKLNIKILAIISLVLLATTMTVAFAEETNKASFDLPKGYNVSGQTDNSTTITNGSDTIIITETSDISAATNEVTNKGFTLANETTYKFEDKDFDIHQQNYVKDNSEVIVYDFKKDNRNYVITFYPQDGHVVSNEANPITGIVETLK